jgi:superfamily II DNA or RNA helicase
MIDLNKIKGREALSKLITYKGKNPYLINFREELKRNSKLTLTNNQETYILENYNKEIIKIDRVVSISKFIGEELKAKYDLKFVPERMYFGFILAETDKSYHVYGRLTVKQSSSAMYWIPKTQVMEDPYFTPVDITVDFKKYIDIDSMNRTPFGYQEDGVKFLLSRNKCILADDMGLGKCISTSESVYCPTGKVKMGDLKIGDYVIGSDGKKTKVLEVHPQPKRELFKITFNDGYYTTCCGEHMWTVTSNNGSVNNKNRPVRYTNLTVEQMLNQDLELEQIGFGWNEKRPYKFKTYYKLKNGDNKWQIPIVKPIEFENEYNLPIEPYLLGVALGDGHINKYGCLKIQLHKDDFDEIFNKQPINEISSTDNKRCNSINILKSEIINLKLNGSLSHTKFIPEIYKYTSVEDRLSILQGLMDTDGHCMKSKNGNFNGTEYCSVSEQLSNDVAEIVHSLGGIVRKRSKIGSYKKPDGTKVICKLAYRLNIKLPKGMNPFRLKRKADEYNTPEKYKVGRYIKNIESIGDGDSVCIKVDAEDSLFVINHGIVTHNTYQSIIAAIECEAKKVLIITPSSTKINWKREIEMFGERSISMVNSFNWKSSKFTIVNYDILKNFHTITPSRKAERDAITHWVRDMYNENFDLIICDEAHKLKDNKSKRGAIVLELSKNPLTKRIWLLTGTPVANRPKDFYSLLNIIDSPLGANWDFYMKRYCDAKYIYKQNPNPDGKPKKILVTNGESNLDELSIKSRNYVLRRLKTDSLDLPEKLVTPLYNELTASQRIDYEYLWEAYMLERAANKKRGTPDRALVEIMLLRKFMAQTSIPNTIELAEDAIEEGQKVVIFTTFNEELQELAEHFGNSCVIHNGSMSDKDKQISVDRFQTNDKVKVFIGNIISAGVGITLTKGTVVIFNSFDWVPGNNEQAEDRCVFGNQLIMTNRGYVMIEDIKIGDFVYTHKGNFKEVIDTHTHLERNKTRVDIDAFGYNDKLSLTNDHKVYVYDSKVDEFKWVEAGVLDITKHRLTLKSNNQPLNGKEYLDVINYTDEFFINNYGVKQRNGRLKKLPEMVILTNELLYAFGFFIAEGWAVNGNSSKSASVNVCQKIDNNKMYDASVYIINIIKEAFNIDSYEEYVDKNGCKTCTIYSKDLSINFNNWFGKGVKNKCLPDWVDELNVEQLENLLDGYYHGDGYRRKNTQQAVTASNKLGSQLIRYNANLGRGVTLKIVDNLYYNVEYTVDINNKLNRIYKVGEHLTYPIKTIHISKPKRGEERVYDLSVKDDHSFVVGGYNVHNCYRIGQTSMVNIYYQLFEDTINTRMWYTLSRKRDIINQIIGTGTAKEMVKLIDYVIEND